MSRGLTAVCAAALLAGCVSAPSKNEVEAAVRGALEASTSGSAAANTFGALGWESVGGPQFQAVLVLGLDSAPDLEAAAARLVAANASASEASAGLFPEIRAGMGGRRGETAKPEGAAADRLDPEDRRRENIVSFGPRVEASYEVDLWGRVRAGRRAARADFAGAQADLDAARITVAGEAALAWIDYSAATKRRAIVLEALSIARAAQEILEAQAEAGAISEADAARARAEVALFAARAEALAVEAAQARARLLALLALPPERLSAPDGEALSIGVGGEIPALAVAARPDVRAAEARLAAAGARVTQARRAVFPTLTLVGSGEAAARTLSTSFDAASFGWSFGADVLGPIVDGGARRAQVTRAEADRIELAARYRNVAATALAEADAAVAVLAGRAAERAAAEERAQAQAVVLEAARAREANGAISGFELTRDAREALDAREAEVEARRAEAAAYVGLLRAAGVRPGLR